MDVAARRQSTEMHWKLNEKRLLLQRNLNSTVKI